MLNINLYINKQSVRAEAPEVFSGSVGVLTVTLFGELDSSLIPVLRFMHESGEGYYTAKIENGCATVPHEVIHAPGFSIAVAGYENDGESVKRFLPTEAAYIPVKENGYGSPDDAVSEEEDSESLIGQILSECQSVRGEVTDAKNELLEAKDEMTDSILAAKEELNQRYSNLKNEFIDMGDALLGEEAERKKGDDTLTEAVASERAARIAADDALLLRISKEEEARQTADSELEERITNAESGIKAAEDELIVSIKSEAAERESSDIRLQTELDKKVDKEDGKGLSDISRIDHMGHAFVDGTMGGNLANATEFYHEFVITRQSGTEDSISVYDTEQTCAVIDEKLSSFKPSQDVDLSNYYTSEAVDEKLESYVKKEDGKGLSKIQSVDFREIGIDDDIHEAAVFTFNDGATGTMHYYSYAQMKDILNNGYYTKDETDNLLDGKHEIINRDIIDIELDDEYYCTVLLDDNTETVFNGTMTESHTLSISDGAHDVFAFVGLHGSFIFTTGETVPSVSYSGYNSVKWVGDDCDSDGNFTPSPNTTYEVDFKCVSANYSEDVLGNIGFIIARVGAC